MLQHDRKAQLGDELGNLIQRMEIALIRAGAGPAMRGRKYRERPTMLRRWSPRPRATSTTTPRCSRMCRRAAEPVCLPATNRVFGPPTSRRAGRAERRGDPSAVRRREYPIRARIRRCRRSLSTQEPAVRSTPTSHWQSAIAASEVDRRLSPIQDPQRDDDLLQRSVARPLADTVDGNADRARASFYGGERVRGSRDRDRCGRGTRCRCRQLRRQRLEQRAHPGRAPRHRRCRRSGHAVHRPPGRSREVAIRSRSARVASSAPTETPSKYCSAKSMRLSIRWSSYSSSRRSARAEGARAESSCGCKASRTRQRPRCPIRAARAQEVRSTGRPSPTTSRIAPISASPIAGVPTSISPTPASASKAAISAFSAPRTRRPEPARHRAASCR